MFARLVTTALFADVVDTNEIVVVARSGGLGFAAQATNELLVAARERRVETLDGDVDVEVEVVGSIDGSHSTATELVIQHTRSEDAIAIDRHAQDWKNLIRHYRVVIQNYRLINLKQHDRFLDKLLVPQDHSVLAQVCLGKSFGQNSIPRLADIDCGQSAYHVQQPVR